MAKRRVRTVGLFIFFIYLSFPILGVSKLSRTSSPRQTEVLLRLEAILLIILSLEVKVSMILEKVVSMEYLHTETFVCVQRRGLIRTLGSLYDDDQTINTRVAVHSDILVMVDQCR